MGTGDEALRIMSRTLTLDLGVRMVGEARTAGSVSGMVCSLATAVATTASSTGCIASVGKGLGTGTPSSPGENLRIEANPSADEASRVQPSQDLVG